MTSPGDSLRVTLLITDLLEKMGIIYAVGGSLASSVHGVMRSTLDVDIIADLRYEHIQPFVAALESDFYTDDEMIRSAIENDSSFNLIHYETAFKVDIFIPKNRAFDKSQLERRAAKAITADSTYNIYVTSAEDILLLKLERFRLGGEVSDRQWQDCLGVAKMQTSQLDLEYLTY